MPENLENLFLDEVRKLKQKKRKRIIQRIGVLLLFVALGSGLAYLLHQGASAISTTTPLLMILALIVICSFVIYVIQHPTFKSRFPSSLTSLESPLFSRLKQIKIKYLLGFILLLLAIIYQSNPTLILNPVNSFVTSVVYQPKPPVANSPWPWKNRQTIHPLVTNMPSHVETSIESVAKYIAQQESDPYLRVKALHDYVVNRVTYDLDVLKTGTRPPQDAQTVFSTHKGVCEGYANLFIALGRAIGLDVVYVRGRVRRDLAPVDLIPQVLRVLNSGYDWTLHAWNAVKILDNWQLVDTTWDDSEIGYSYSAEYLTPPPQVMSMSHFPEQSGWQLLSRAEDYNTFEKKPILTPHFFAEELVLISPTEYQTNVQKVAAIKIKNSPNDPNRIVALFTKAQKAESSFWDLLGSGDLAGSGQSKEEKLKNFKRCNSQWNVKGETQISCRFPEAGDYEVFVFSLGKEKVNPIGQLKFHAL